MFEKLKSIYKGILNIIKTKNKVLQLDTINYEKIIELMKEKGIYQEFENTFNVFEQDNNIIHRAFKIANSFTFLDEDEYPKEQIVEVFNNMTSLVNESFKICNPEQQKVVQEIMLKEADHNNLRYGHYDKFISFKKLRNLVSMKDKEEELSRDSV